MVASVALSVNMGSFVAQTFKGAHIISYATRGCVSLLPININPGTDYIAASSCCHLLNPGLQNSRPYKITEIDHALHKHRAASRK